MNADSICPQRERRSGHSGKHEPLLVCTSVLAVIGPASGLVILSKRCQRASCHFVNNAPSEGCSRISADGASISVPHVRRCLAEERTGQLIDADVIGWREGGDRRLMFLR